MTTDPLDGAAIGETKRIIETVDLYGINMAPDVFIGSDRFGDHDIANVEIIETEDYNNIRVTWEGDVTKRLPGRWDYHSEPVTTVEKRSAKRKKWIGRVLQSTAVILPIMFAMWVGTVVMNRALVNMTINGEPVGPVSFQQMLPPIVGIGLITLLLWIGLEKGGLPGHVRTR